MEKNLFMHQFVKKMIDEEIIDAAYQEQETIKNEEVNLHLVITENKYQKFIKLYNNILESISNVVYIKKNKDNTYIKFDNDLSCVIYLEIDNFYVYGDFNVFYDPNGKLLKAVITPTPDIIGETLNEITYNLDRFFNYFRIEDKLTAMTYLSKANENVLLYFKYLYYPQNTYRNYKSLITDLPRDLKPKYNKMLSKLKIDSLIECAKMVFVLMDNFVSSISINVAFVFDIDYYLYIKKLIFTY